MHCGWCRRFAGSKVRILDQQFIELFNLDIPYEPKYKPSWL
jgi:tyrosine-protein phosphatase SIW14